MTTKDLYYIIEHRTGNTSASTDASSQTYWTIMFPSLYTGHAHGYFMPTQFEDTSILQPYTPTENHIRTAIKTVFEDQL